MNKKIQKKTNILDLLKKSIKIAKIQNPYTLILNQGSKDGVEEGQRYQVYSIGEEIFDPDTKKSLGNIEIIKGTGRISHLQESMSILSSDMKSEALRSFKKTTPGRFDVTGLSMLTNPWKVEVEEELPSKKIAFSKPNIGDLVRKI